MEDMTFYYYELKHEFRSEKQGVYSVSFNHPTVKYILL